MNRISNNLKAKAFLAALIIAMCLATGTAQAQRQAVCGTDEYYKAQAKTHPEILVKQKEMDAYVASLRQASFKTNTDSGQVIVVPVVFHIIYNTNGPENINKQTIDDQINRLNIDYRKKNSDTTKIRAMFKNLATDARIEFRLAKVDPWGRCTNGVDRIISVQTENATESVKALSWWDSRQYLNIWVVRAINQDNLPPGQTLAGYSHFPWDATTSPWADGIIMNYKFIGKNERTLTHEIGHYFGLYHTFQDSCSTDQDIEGDHVRDTPPVAKASFGWSPGVNSCHSDNPDLPDMIENYMDYADNKYLFTPEQVYRMRAFALGRYKLVSGDNLTYVLQSPCISGIDEGSSSIAGISVYPNPSSGIITLEIDAETGQQAAISITDITGKSIFMNPDLALVQGNQKITFSKQDLKISSAGVYFLKLSIGNNVVQKKIVFID